VGFSRRDVRVAVPPKEIGKERGWEMKEGVVLGPLISLLRGACGVSLKKAKARTYMTTLLT
jgi:hypothetical protein